MMIEKDRLHKIADTPDLSVVSDSIEMTLSFFSTLRGLLGPSTTT